MSVSIAALSPPDLYRARTTVDVDIVIPVHNEAEQLAHSIARLRSYVVASFPFTSTITIADNASTDGTWRIAADLAATRPGVQAIRLNQKGRGRALRAAWSQSTASVVAYMDVDLATGLDALVPLVAPLLSGHSDLAIGTRLARGAHVVRGARRELISRGYNLLLRSALRSSCTDAQCGFKAMRRQAAIELLPLVEDDEWFFDTEVLVTAQRLGLRIHEVPVHWVDDTDSRVDIVRTALRDLRGVWRLLGPAARHQVRRTHRARRMHPIESGAEPVRSTGASMPPPGWPAGRSAAGPASHDVPRSDRALGARAGSEPGREVFADELLRFAGVGAVSTVIYVGLFAALRPDLGSVAANAVAIGLCSLGNSAVHRGMVGAAGRRLGSWHRWAGATGLLAVSLGFTTLALTLVRAAGFESLLPELVALTVANLAAAVIRFGILRTWVFRPAFGSNLAGPARAGSRTDSSPPLTGTSIEERGS
ncbi:MAG: glycosyltransferase [Acidimicrobiales bacterium]